jgi:hypothetical protein
LLLGLLNSFSRITRIPEWHGLPILSPMTI